MRRVRSCHTSESQAFGSQRRHHRFQTSRKTAGHRVNICAFISISLSEADKYNVVIAHLKKIPEVVECHFVTGKYALLVKIYCFDNDHLMEILLNTIQKIPYILSTETMIALDEAIDRQVWVKDYSNTSYSGSNKNDDSDE